MNPLGELGRWLLLLGGGIALLGLLLLLVGRIPGLGRLPGDIVIQRDGFSCFFPLTTMILLSIVLTILLNLIARLWK
ncbi:MAG TPA: DUF2905 domain-containing protein [Anaerolineae bacterium]|nr:DUF2905 domain-containing protein [Anaerolineae bacterium]